MPLLHHGEERRVPLRHGLAAIIILIEAYEKLEVGSWHIGGPLIGIGLLLMLYALFHARAHHSAWAPHLETGALLAECGVFLLTAIFLAEQHKKALPLCYSALTAAYLVLAIHQHRRKLNVHLHKDTNDVQADQADQAI